jgi:hypothetical protein
MQASPYGVNVHLGLYTICVASLPTTRLRQLEVTPAAAADSDAALAAEGAALQSALAAETAEGGSSTSLDLTALAALPPSLTTGCQALTSTLIQQLLSFLGDDASQVSEAQQLLSATRVLLIIAVALTGAAILVSCCEGIILPTRILLLVPLLLLFAALACSVIAVSIWGEFRSRGFATAGPSTLGWSFTLALVSAALTAGGLVFLLLACLRPDPGLQKRRPREAAAPVSVETVYWSGGARRVGAQPLSSRQRDRSAVSSTPAANAPALGSVRGGSAGKLHARAISSRVAAVSTDSVAAGGASAVKVTTSGSPSDGRAV